jgi:hypothetical protein
MKEMEHTKELVMANVEQTSEMYLNNNALRAVISFIPCVGSSFDVLLSGEGAKIQYERIMKYLDYLHERLEKLEVVNVLEPNGYLWDLLVTTFDGVVRERSDEKRKRFASIIVKQVKENGDMGEAIDAVTLLRDLNDIHIEVLRAVLNAPVCDGVFEGLQVVALKDVVENDTNPSVERLLEDCLTNFDEEMLRIACAQLVSKGLLHDEGIGRAATPGMKYFIITDAGRWFVDWILEENELKRKL